MLGRKVIYVRCINCSYNNVAKCIRLLDKNAFFVYTGNISCFMQVRAFERYIPLSHPLVYSFVVFKIVNLILWKEKYILGRSGLYFGGFWEK